MMSQRVLIKLLGLSRQIEELHSQLKEKDLEINRLKSEISRFQLAETTVDMSADDSKKEYIRALEQRDQRIDQLKTELENVTRLKNQELANLTQKMEFIMDEKDHQIKRLNALGGDSKKEGNARKEAISAETGRKNFDGKLPVISKTKEQSELISGKLL